MEGYQRPVCPACGWTYYEDPKVAVAVLIGRDGRILLNRRAIQPGLGKWSFPSGYVNRGEVLEAAAAREVQEETGLEVQIRSLFGVYSERGNAVILVVYTADATVGSRRPAPKCRKSAGSPRTTCRSSPFHTTTTSSPAGALGAAPAGRLSACSSWAALGGAAGDKAPSYLDCAFAGYLAENRYRVRNGRSSRAPAGLCAGLAGHGGR